MRVLACMCASVRVCAMYVCALHRHMGDKRAAQHIPSFAKTIVSQYNTQGEINKRLQLQPGKSAAGRGGSSSSKEQ